MMRKPYAMLAVCAGLLSWSAGAEAQFDGDTIRIFAVGELGLAGSQSADTPAGDVDIDLDPSYGVAGGADYGLHDLFAVGGMVRWLSVGADGADERGSLTDLAVYPRLRLPLPIVEVYGMVPVGVTFASPGGDADSETGWTLGLLAGAQVGILPILDLVAQVGWTSHNYGDVGMSELTLNAGLAIGL